MALPALSGPERLAGLPAAAPMRLGAGLGAAILVRIAGVGGVIDAR